MAAQEIGLAGIFDLKGWDAGMRRYTKELAGAMSQTDKAAGSFGQSWNRMGTVVGNVSKIMAVGIVAAGAAAGAAITGFAVGGIKQAMDLQAQMSNIAAVLNTTSEAVAPLKQLIMDLALDPNLTVNTTEAANAIENLAKNGLTMQEILDGAAHSTVLLANATGADFGLAADIATDAMALFNIEAKDMAVAVDGITSVTVASKFGINDYRLALSQAGGVAAASGVSFADFNAAITAISPAFASGSDAGTSFKTMIQRLIPQSTEAKDLMMELGLMTEDGSNKFFDASGNMKSMNEVAILLNGALAGLTEEQRLNAVTILAGADASRAMLGLMESGAVVYTDAATAAKELGVTQEEVNKVIEGGITQLEALQLQMGLTDAVEQAEERNRNFAAALKILQDTIGGVQLAIGDLFLPMLEEMARSLNDLIKENAPAIIAFFQSFRDDLIALGNYLKIVVTDGDLMNDWLTHMSPTLATVVVSVTALAGAIGVALGGALSFIKDHMAAFQGALVGIATVLAAATITAGITAIAGALATLVTPIGLVIIGAGLLGAAWNTNFLGMRDTTLAVVGEIQTAFTPLSEAIAQFGSGALTEIQNFVTGAETEFTNLNAIWDGAKESVTNLVNAITQEFPQLAPVFSGFGVVVGLIVEQVKAQFVLLQDATSAMVSLVTSLISGDWAGAWQSAQDLAGAFVTYITTTFANLKSVFETPFNEIKTLTVETFTGLTTEVTTQLPGWQATLAEWGIAAWQWLQDAATQLLMALGGWALVLTTYVDANLETWKTVLAQWGLAAWQWIVDASVIVGQQMAAWGTAVTGYVTDNLPTWTATLASWSTAAWQWIAAAILVVGQQMATWGAAVLGYVTDNLPTWTAELTKWTTVAWRWISNAVALVGVEIARWGATILDYVTDNLPAWTANLAEWTTVAWRWLVNAAGPLLTALGGWLVALTGFLALSLPTWQAQFTEWTTAAWEWIVDASTEAVRQLGVWATDVGNYLINTALPQFRTKMLEWATALVEWIGSSAADALPELGKWLGKITAWIVIGALQLTIEMAKFAIAIISWIPGAIAQLPAKLAELKDALINWITGAGGEGGEGSLVAEADPAMQKFQTALITALGNIKEGFIGAVQEFVRAFADTLSEYIDWEFVGANIMTFVRNGISSMLDPITTKAGEIAESAKNVWTTIVDWLQLGKDIIQFVIDGLQAMLDLGTLATKAEELATSAKDEFLAIDWLQLGKDIIAGIKDGLEAKGGEIVSYIVGLGQDALDSIKSLFGIGSPSKVMAEIGKDIIEGWIIGMRSQESRLYQAIQGISDGVARIAGRAGADVISTYTNALSSFATLGGGLLDQIGGLPGSTSAALLIGDEQRTLDILQQQADLIEAIRASGADPAEVLRGVKLGLDADPVALARIVGATMANLNNSLLISLQNATSGLDKEIENARARRESVADVEERMAQKDIDMRAVYASRLADIDKQIAQTEESAIRTGNRNSLLRIQELDNRRGAIVKEIELLITQERELERILARQPVSENQRGQAVIERWRETMIEPLVRGFDFLSASARTVRLQEIDRHMRLIQGFAAQLPSLANAEARLQQALEGFGSAARQRAEHLLNLVYDPRMASVAAGRAQSIHDFANSLMNLRGELERLSGQRMSGESIIERALGGFDQLTAYQNALEAVDRQIANVESFIMETGSANSMSAIRALDTARAQRQADIENFIRQTQAIKQVMSQVKNLSGPGQASAERFFQEQIQSIANAFSAPMRSVDRDAWIRTAQMRADMINRFVEQMRALERVQNRVAGNQSFAHLADEFAMLQDILMPETQRASLISQLDSYITQMMRLHQIQTDITQGRGINPLVDRFASERLDAVARQLENINLSEAERNRLIEQYRMEQEKILALQQKQQQLEFINQQLALIEQLRSLDEEEDWSVNVENILSGIQFGINASIDDLMRLTGRVLDELIRFANHELGIASPSKIFTKVGTNIMAGLEEGILAGMRFPMNALRNAAGNLIPYSLNQRTLAVNMGGVTINNGLDDIMFEAKIRQIIRSEFAT